MSTPFMFNWQMPIAQNQGYTGGQAAYNANPYSQTALQAEANNQRDYAVQQQLQRGNGYVPPEADYSNLQAELVANEAKIAELRSELQQIVAGGKLSADERDRMLAANRAKIGDLANSIYHQGRPEQRRMIDIREKETKQYQVNDLQIKNQQLAYAYRFAKDTQTRKDIEYQIEANNNKIKSLGGSPISLNFSDDAGNSTVAKETPAQLEQAMKNALTVGADKNQYLREDADLVDLGIRLAQVDPTGENAALQDLYRELKQRQKWSDYIGADSEENFLKLIAKNFNAGKGMYNDPLAKSQVDDFYNRMKYRSKAVEEAYAPIKDKTDVVTANDNVVRRNKALATAIENKTWDEVLSEGTKKTAKIKYNGKWYTCEVKMNSAGDGYDYWYGNTLIATRKK